MKQFDAIILGGGVVGCLSALQLVRRKVRCLLLESHSLNAGASGQSAGGLYFQLPHQAGSFAQLARQRLEDLVPLIRASEGAWERLAADVPEVHVHRSGGVVLATTADQEAALQQKWAMEQNWGIPTELLSQRALKAAMPSCHDRILAGTLHRREGFCDPRRLALQAAAEATAAGVEIRTTAPAVNIERAKDFTVTTQSGERYSAPQLIVALGAGTGAMLDHLGVTHGIFRLPIQMCATVPSQLRVPLFTRYAGGRLSIKTIPDGSIWIGGGWPATPGATAQLDQTSLTQNIRLALHLIPNLSAAELAACWADIVAWTDDGLPVVGGHPKYPGLWLACGGNGFALAPLYAEILADLATDHKPELDLRPFMVDRFSAATKANATAATTVPTIAIATMNAMRCQATPYGERWRLRPHHQGPRLGDIANINPDADACVVDSGSADADQLPPD